MIGFQGWGHVIDSNVCADVLLVHFSWLDIKDTPEAWLQNELRLLYFEHHSGEPLAQFAGQRVAVEGYLDTSRFPSKMVGTYIGTLPESPSTSSTPDATMSTTRSGGSMDTQQVVMKQVEFDEKSHAEFKAGLRHGMNIALKFLRSAAIKRFSEKKDAEAMLYRDAADCLEEEKDTQRKTSYRIRPHID